MDNMFSDCSSLISLNITDFDTSQVISMNYLFNGCSSLTELDISNFNTSLTTSMEHMFSGCGLLKNLSVESFNVSLVTSMEYLFANCYSLQSLNLSNFDTSNVVNMRHMFENCSKLLSLDLNSFQTPNVRYMDYMFHNCSLLEEILMENFEISLVKDLSHMFDGCVALYWIDLSKFDTIATTNMEYMFYKCNDLGYINLNLLNDTNLIKYDNIFGGTPENMVFCFDISNDKLYKQMVYKKCSKIDCIHDWTVIREKSINATGECTEACKRNYRFFYHHKCYERCPGKTVSVNLVCQKKVEEYNETQRCNIKNYFYRKCNMTLNTPLEKKKFIENTTKEILNTELYEIINNKK